MQNTKYSANEKHQRVHQDPGHINYNCLKAMSIQDICTLTYGPTTRERQRETARSRTYPSIVVTLHTGILRLCNTATTETLHFGPTHTSLKHAAHGHAAPVRHGEPVVWGFFLKHSHPVKAKQQQDPFPETAWIL